MYHLLSISAKRRLDVDLTLSVKSTPWTCRPSSAEPYKVRPTRWDSHPGIDSSFFSVFDLGVTDSYHDSPPLNQRFCLTERFMAARHKEGYDRKKSVHKFSCAQRPIGRWRRGFEGHRTVFQEIRPGGAGFETGDFVKRKVGGATTVERLVDSAGFACACAFMSHSQGYSKQGHPVSYPRSWSEARAQKWHPIS